MGIISNSRIVITVQMKTALLLTAILGLVLAAPAQEPSPVVGGTRVRADKNQQVLALNNTGTGYTVPIYFGSPVQIVGIDGIPLSTFAIDTTYTNIVVASVDCGNPQSQ